jgi:hypothetical protein
VAEAYEDEFNEDAYYDEPEPRRGMSGWLIALIVILVIILLCCICAGAVLILAGPAIGDVFHTILETLTPMP